MKKDKLVSLQPGRKNDDVCHNSLTIGQEGHFSHLLLHCDEVNHWGSGTTLTHICRRNAQDRKKRSDVDCPIWPPTWRSCRRAGRSLCHPLSPPRTRQNWLAFMLWPTLMPCCSRHLSPFAPVQLVWRRNVCSHGRSSCHISRSVHCIRSCW
jgi:hypothetical protein